MAELEVAAEQNAWREKKCEECGEYPGHTPFLCIAFHALCTTMNVTGENGSMPHRCARDKACPAWCGQKGGE